MNLAGFSPSNRCTLAAQARAAQHRGSVQAVDAEREGPPEPLPQIIGGIEAPQRLPGQEQGLLGRLARQEVLEEQLHRLR